MKSIVLSKYNSLLPLIVAVLLFSIDMSTYLNEFFPVATIKTFMILLSVVLMLCFRKKNIKKQSWIWGAIMLYFVLLFFRLFSDFVVPWKGFFIYQSPITILFFFVMTMVIPFVFYRRKNVNIDNSLWGIIAGIFLAICLGVSFNENLLIGKMMSINGQLAGEGTVDIITYGHLGCTLTLIGIYIMLNKPKPVVSLLCVFFIAIGLVTMAFSGARSPFVALPVCALLLAKSKIKKKGIVLVLAVIIFFLVPVMTQYLFRINAVLEDAGINSFSRVVDFFSSEDTVNSSGRDSLYGLGWKFFLEDPLLGHSYLLPDGGYVHNIFLEQFMALGIFGGTLFLIINIKAVVNCWIIIKRTPQDSLFPILFIQYLIYGLFSRTIIALIPYWLFLFISMNRYDSIRNGIRNNSNI